MANLLSSISQLCPGRQFQTPTFVSRFWHIGLQFLGNILLILPRDRHKFGVASPRYDLVFHVREFACCVRQCLANCSQITSTVSCISLHRARIRTLITDHLSPKRISDLSSGVEICDVQVSGDAG